MNIFQEKTFTILRVNIDDYIRKHELVQNIMLL